VDEDATALGSGLWLANEEANWIYLGLLFCHLAVKNLLSAFFRLLFSVLLDVVELCRVHPSLRKEFVMIRKLFLKSLQMHTQRAFSANVIHA
jgi:hypothetical protein